MLATKRCLADLFLGSAGYPGPRLCRDATLGVLASSGILGWGRGWSIYLLGFRSTAATTTKKNHQGHGAENGDACFHGIGGIPHKPALGKGEDFASGPGA
jgi:hypothetical protein